MRRILLLDTETSGLDPAVDHLLEVGLVVWSVEHRCILEAGSWILRAPGNPAEHLNGIPPAILAEGRQREPVVAAVRRLAEGCSAIVAHNGEFDRLWLPELAGSWIDSAWDLDWPRAGADRRLVSLALAHGLAVLDAHRALTDCILLARLLERVGELGHDVAQLLERAVRPKVRVVSLLPYSTDNVATVKAAGFRWRPESKEWWRMLAAEDVAALPFPAEIDDGSRPARAVRGRR